MIALAVVAVVAAVAAVVANSRQVTLEPGTPEATVQGYLTAVIDGDVVAAAVFLDPSGKCDGDDLDRFQMGNVAEARLVDSQITGEIAKVSVDLEMGSNGLFNDVWKDRQTFQLKKSNGAWVITGTPWPMYDCAGVIK